MKRKIELPEGVNKYQFIFCRHYRYLTTGMSLTNLVKYAAVLFGVGSIIQTGSSKLAMLSLAGYAVFCYLLGMFWYKSGFIFAEQEVGNQFDMFEREVREHIKTKKFK